MKNSKNLRGNRGASGRSAAGRRAAVRRYRRTVALRVAAFAALAALAVAVVALMPGQGGGGLARQEDFTIPLTLPEAGEGAMPDFPAPAATPMPEPKPDGEAFEYLPVLRRAETDRKRIAITVDDCFQPDNLRTIIDSAHAAGGKLTIFPIGENLAKPGMAQILRRAVFELGYEIENHTWSHQRVFRLPERQMAEEIWRQSQAVNRALGVNYEEHFFRLMGGDGDSDQRTHNYLGQLGFRGIANWSLSGSDAGMDEIKRALKPGAVYLFHTTDADTAKLRTFIPYAAAQGYELVTMNELFGLEANAVTAYAEAPMPQPRAYREDYRTHRQGDYAWNIVGMQNALREMGYLRMDGPSTGYYGPMTAEAIRRYQQACGLEATGVADSATQRRLLNR